MTVENQSDNSALVGEQPIFDLNAILCHKKNRKKFEKVSITSIEKFKKNHVVSYAGLALKSGGYAAIKQRKNKKLLGFCIEDVALTREELEFLHDEMHVREFVNVDIDLSSSKKESRASLEIASQAVLPTFEVPRIPLGLDRESITSQALCEALFGNEDYITYGAQEIHNIDLSDCFDLSVVENKIGSDIAKQREFIAAMLARLSFSAMNISWRTSQGVKLPKFIEVQIKKITPIKNIFDLQEALKEADKHLEKLSKQSPFIEETKSIKKKQKQKQKHKHGEAFKRAIKAAQGGRVIKEITHPVGLCSTELTPTEFDCFVKTHHFKNFHGCTVSGSIDLSMQKKATKKARTLRNFIFPAADAINLCNTVLVGGLGSNVPIREIIFNAKTDFRDFNFSQTCLEKETRITYVGLDETAVTLTVEELLSRLEATYYHLRGGKKGKLKSDFFSELDGMRSGEKLIAILKHAQSQANRVVQLGRKHRTLDAFHAVLNPILDQSRASKKEVENINKERKKIIDSFQSVARINISDDAQIVRANVVSEESKAYADFQRLAELSRETAARETEKKEWVAERERVALGFLDQGSGTASSRESFFFFSFLNPDDTFQHAKIIQDRTDFYDAVIAVKKALEFAHAETWIANAESILSDALHKIEINTDNENEILSSFIFLDALGMNDYYEKAEIILSSDKMDLRKKLRAYRFLSLINPALAQKYENDALEKIENFFLSYDGSNTENRRILINRAANAYRFLLQTNPTFAKQCLDVATEKMFALDAASYVFLKAVDPIAVVRFSDKQKAILTAFSSFSAFMGDDAVNDEVSQLRRKKNERAILVACRFLKMHGDYAAVEKYERDLKCVSYHYFNYTVLKSCRMRDDRDKSKKQICFLDHNTLEELFIYFDTVSDAKILESKSYHRDDAASLHARFFKMPRKHSTPKEQYEALCAKQWLLTPIDILIQVGCFARDEKMIKDDLVARAAVAAQNQVIKQGISSRLIEKQIFIAELIKRGKLHIANDILIACGREWADMELDSAVTQAIYALKEQAYAEVRANLSCDGTACKKLHVFSQSSLSKNPVLRKVMHEYKLIEFEQVVVNSVFLTKAITNLTEFLLISPASVIEIALLDKIACIASCSSLELFVDDDTLSRWIVSFERLVSCRVLGDAKCDVIRVILNTLKEAKNKKILKSVADLKNIIRVAYQADAAYQWARDALSCIWNYPKIQWAMMRENETGQGVGMLVKIRSLKAIPDKDKAYTVTKKEKLVEWQGVAVNANYAKYQCAFALQEKLLSLKRGNAQEIPKYFCAVIDELKEIQGLLKAIKEGGGEFAKCISTALDKMIAAEKKWRSEVSKTIALSSEVSMVSSAPSA